MKKQLILFIGLSLLLSCINISMADSKDSNRVVKYNGIPAEGNILIYAHRGGRGLSPENTLPAYNSSLRIGVDYIDMDIQMTKDKILIISHDEHLDPVLTRDKNGDWISENDLIYFRSITVKEAQKYDVGQIKPNTDYAESFPYQAKMNNIPMPTLIEAIKLTKKSAGSKVGFQIEIKHNPNKAEYYGTPKEIAENLYKILKEEEILDRTEVQAFNWECLIELNKIDPNLKTAFLTGSKTNLKSIYSKDPKEAGIWTGGHLIKDYDNSIPKMIKTLGGYCHEPSTLDITEKDVKEAHELGLKVVVWSYVGKEDDSAFPTDIVLKLLNWGVDGIITDRPDELRGILSSRGYKVPESFNVPCVYKNNFIK